MNVMRVALVALAGCGFQTAGGPDAMTPEEQPGQGVEIDAAIDASIDGGFDLESCPENYDVDVPGPTRYRLISDARAAWDHSDDCNNDLAGSTHLVVFETMQEVIAVDALIDANGGLPGNAVWIGGVQQRGATQVNQNWLAFDDTPLINGWATNEPNDGTTESGGEQYVKLERGKDYFVDVHGTDGYSALCECDGKPVAPNAAAAIASQRP
jgi:hypothetical protein